MIGVALSNGKPDPGGRNEGINTEHTEARRHRVHREITAKRRGAGAARKWPEESPLIPGTLDTTGPKRIRLRRARARFFPVRPGRQEPKDPQGEKQWCKDATRTNERV